jgi:hypothetical protein
MNDSSISPQSINSTKNNSSQTNNQRNPILCKNSTQRLKFSNKVRSQRQSHITQAKNEKPNTKKRHCCCCTSKIFQCFCMCSIIQGPNTLKQRRAPYPVSQHCKNRTKNSNFIHCKQCLYNHTHMGNTTICNNFFLINLSQSCLTPINNSNQTNSANPWSQISTPFRKHILIETLESISSLFQQYSCQKNTSSCTPFHMSFRLPQMQWHQRNFNSKGLEESPPKKQLTTRFNRQLPQQQIVCCSSPTVQQQKTRKHCQTSNQSIKYLQISSTYFSSTTSSQSNQLKHGQQRTLIEYIKTLQVQTCKTPKLKTFQGQQQPIKRLTMSILSIPTTQYSQRHESCSKQNHPKTQTIQTKFLFNPKQPIPTPTQTNNLLKRLNCCWYKPCPQTSTLNQCYQSKKQCIKTMQFAFFPRLYTKKKCPCLWYNQYSCKQSFKRNCLLKGCSQYTQTKYLWLHFLFYFLLRILFFYSLFIF